MNSEFEIIRVFPRRNKWTPVDDLAFIGDPPLIRPLDRKIPVRISITFTWDKDEGRRLYKAWQNYYDDVQLGGPAFNDSGNEFTPGLYIKNGVVITSRGCNRNCRFCFVSKREGKIRELEIKDGYIIQDNNILACSENHIRAVFDMLKNQKKSAVFSGGLDIRLFNENHIKLLSEIRFAELWFSCDSKILMKKLEYISKMIDFINQNKKRCYVLIGFNGETLGEAEYRLQKIYDLGFKPFAQLYRNKDNRYKKYSKDWLKLARRWSRPAAYCESQSKEVKKDNENTLFAL